MKVIRLKFVIIGLVLLILGGVSLWYSTSDRWSDASRQVAGQLTSVLLISGMWTLVQEYFVRGEFEEQKRGLVDRIDNLHQLSLKAQNVGLVDVVADSRTRSKSEILETARHLTVLMNDGRTFVNSNLFSFRRRFSRPETTTRYLVVHPNSEFLPILAHKVGEPPEEIQKRILQACKLLTDEHGRIPQPARGKLEIYGHNMPTNFAALLTDETLIMILYTTASGRTHVPLFEFQPKGVDMPYEHFKRDLEALIADRSELLYSNGAFVGILNEFQLNPANG